MTIGVCMELNHVFKESSILGGRGGGVLFEEFKLPILVHIHYITKRL